MTKSGVPIVLFVFVTALALGLTGAASADVYSLEKCPVSGMKLDSMGEPIVKEYDGREVRFCSGKCPAKFEANPSKYIEEIDSEIVKQQLPRYPLMTCLVSGEKLGGPMGDAVDYVYQNRLIRLCCKDCVKKFVKDPAKFLSKLDAAVIEKQKPGYSLDTCVVSGDKLGGEMGDAVDFVSGNQLVRLCCKGCVKDFSKTPLKYLSMVNKNTSKSAAMPGHDMKNMSKPMTDHASDGHGEHKH